MDGGILAGGGRGWLGRDWGRRCSICWSVNTRAVCVWDKRMRKWGSDDAFGSLVCGRSGKVSSQGGS